MREPLYTILNGKDFSPFARMVYMYIEKVPNRNSPPAVLRRESYREGDQVKKRTLANLSKLPDDIIDNLKLDLKGATLSMTEGIPNQFEVIGNAFLMVM
ncbi:hypothetical protein MiAbW_03050 [Microcystis aeruginosa NIES-4325]|uniref:Uncharacterized protein n=1 Tax=Microcystis aeruginosa NIES-4325 TaxID=2569534 RepID=A0A5J4FD97_MICAE|nr:hypothetical protein MiAbW_03050 [Microcystis aeruginosa NIES-4325]